MSRYRDILDRIESARDEPARADSFARFQAALAEVGSAAGREPPRDRVILVVGTNGKGSVAKGIEALLGATGATVGLFTSPHLVSTTERIRSRGADLTEDEFAATFARVEPLVERHGLSHFETLALMAGDVFFSGAVRPRVDWAVLEAGVGGLWDPTNAFDHASTAVTRLGLDHETILGGSLESIAAHKLGAVRPGSLVVHAAFPPDAAAAFARAKRGLGGRWVQSEPFGSFAELEGGEPRFVLETPWGRVPTDLPGRRAAENLAIAARLFAELGFDPSAHSRALENIGWPGRMETFHPADGPCPVHLSGDHNEQGVRSLLDLLGDYPRGRLHWVIGIGARKDRDAMLKLYASVGDSVLNLTRVPFRGSPPADYGAWLEAAGVVDEDPMSCLRRVAHAASPGDRIVVSGSLYLVGAVRAVLRLGRLR